MVCSTAAQGSRTNMVGQSCGDVPGWHSIYLGGVQRSLQGTSCSSRVIRWKLTEFLALKQGSNSVMQYAQTFNTLSQYAGYHVDTDEKKQACFKQGLSSKLQDRLTMFKFNTFSELVNGAIVQEDAH